MTDKKIILDLENNIAERIYVKLANENWERIDKFTKEMQQIMDVAAEKYSKIIAKELMAHIEVKYKKEVTKR